MNKDFAASEHDSRTRVDENTSDSKKFSNVESDINVTALSSFYRALTPVWVIGVSHALLHLILT
jgi:hypothetical protein